jgi:hypothetical protein
VDVRSATRGRGVLVHILVWACLVGGTGGETARASLPRFHVFAVTYQPAISDGARYVVLPLNREGSVRIVDTVRGAVFEEAAPTVSVSWSSAPEPCFPRAIGDGRLLWSCAGGSSRPNLRIEDLRTRAYAVPTGMEGYRQDRGHQFFSIGRYWLGGLESSNEFHAGGGPTFLNWRTGEIRSPPGVNHFGDHHVEDLNTPGLERSLCPPLTRPRTPVDDPLAPHPSYLYVPYLYESPYAAYLTASGAFRLARCGRRRTTSLAPSPIPGNALFPAAEGAELGAGWITYRISDRVEAVRLADRRAYEWPSETAGLPYGLPSVTHTATRLLASFCNSGYDPDKNRCAVYSASLPRPPSRGRRR